LKVTAQGGSNAWFGPFSLNVGCFTGAVTFTDHPDLVTYKEFAIKAPTKDAYTFMNPISTRLWCTPQTNTIVNPDGSNWSGGTKLSSSSQ